MRPLSSPSASSPEHADERVQNKNLGQRIELILYVDQVALVFTVDILLFLLNFHSYWSSRREEPVIIYCLGWKIFSCVTIKFLTDPPSKLCNILMIPPHWQGSQVFCHPPPLFSIDDN